MQQFIRERAEINDLSRIYSMTFAYNKMSFSELTELQEVAFFNVVTDKFTGANEVRELVNSFWDATAYKHSFTMPDGHVVNCLSKEMVNTRIEVDELDGVTFTYRFEANQPIEKNSALMPNLVHAKSLAL